MNIKTKNIKYKNWKYLLILLLISISIVFIWFRKGELIVGGEEGLWMFNAQRSINHFYSGWIDIGTGYLTSAYQPRIPILYLLLFLQKIFPVFLSQAIIFFLIIFAGLTGMFYLSKEFTGEKNKNAALVISIFYLLNSYTMTQVWNRLIYAGMFSWSFMPIALYFFSKWIKTRKFIFLVLFLVSSIFFSASFVTISFVFVIWVPILLLSVFKIWKERKNKKNLFYLLFNILIFGASWVLVNIWWIYPIFTTSSASLGNMTNLLESNIATLKGVSQYFTNDQIVLLRQSYFFSRGDGRDSFWFDFYHSPLAYIAGIIGLIMVLAGIFSSSKKVIKYKVFLVTLFIGSWFVVKGSNHPFGESFYKFLFSHWGFTMMFRNPYEKLGLIFLLPYSIFFGVGLNLITQKFKSIRLFLLSGLMILICGILVWPMWTGKVFTDRVRLKVPLYYEEANKIIDSDNIDARILVLPLIKGESAFYDWKYMGAVPTDFLFNKGLITRPISEANYFQSLYDGFQNKDTKTLHRLFGELNVGYLIISDDLEKGRNDVQNVDELSDFIKRDTDMIFFEKVNKLSIYKFQNDQIGGQIVAVGENIPNLTYKEINRTEYDVTIINADKPFNLILKNSFDEHWVASIKGEVLNNHNVAYDYANMWKVNRKGDYKIKIFLRIWPWQ